MTEHVKIAVTDHVLHITLARPEKKNALTQAMYVAIGEALTRAESDPAVRVVLIDSEGDAFTAGNDIADFVAVATGALGRDQMQTHIFLDALARATKPYVAAVAGHRDYRQGHGADEHIRARCWHTRARNSGRLDRSQDCHSVTEPWNRAGVHDRRHQCGRYARSGRASHRFWPRPARPGVR